MALADNVVMFNGVVPGDYDASLILELCARKSLKSAVVIGYDQDGDFVFTSSMGSGPECLWLLELAKKRLMEVGD